MGRALRRALKLFENFGLEVMIVSETIAVGDKLCELENASFVAEHIGNVKLNHKGPGLGFLGFEAVDKKAPPSAGDRFNARNKMPSRVTDFASSKMPPLTHRYCASLGPINQAVERSLGPVNQIRPPGRTF